MKVGPADTAAKPFLGSNFQTTLRDLETRMRKAAQDLEFETAARLRDELKRLKMLDLEFARDMVGSVGDVGDELTAREFAPGSAAGVTDAKRRGRGRR